MSRRLPRGLFSPALSQETAAACLRVTSMPSSFTQQLAHMSVVDSRVSCVRARCTMPSIESRARALRLKVCDLCCREPVRQLPSFLYAVRIRLVWRVLTPNNVAACSVVIYPASKWFST